MKIHRKILLSFSILLLSGLGNQLFAQQAGSAGKIATEVKLSQNVVPAGDTVTAAVVMNIEEGWHVNAGEFLKKMPE